MDSKKFQKLSLKDLMKDSASGPRLQSLRLPRDLTLGGTQPSKKIYKPNVNVVRNKTKTETTKKPNNKLKHLDGKRTRDKFQERFVQSTGIFSEGVGERNISNHLKSIPRVHVVDRDEKLSKPDPQPISFKDLKVDQKHEKNILDEIIGDADGSEDDKEQRAPFAPAQWNLNEDFVKTEYDEQRLPLEYTNTTYFKQTPVLTLWQLPDSLAFGNLEDSSSKKETDFTLSKMSEGKIGKICVRASGKIDVYIGSAKYLLEPAQSETFSEELVTLNASERTARVLGEISSRFTLNPDWQSLLL